MHVTLDLAGRMRFGPDVEWIEQRELRCRPATGGRHSTSASATYWPALPDNSLAPDYAGIRPKLTVRASRPADFMIEGPPQHGLDRLVHLFGIELPGLTCALSLAEEVAGYLSA